MANFKYQAGWDELSGNQVLLELTPELKLCLRALMPGDLDKLEKFEQQNHLNGWKRQLLENLLPKVKSYDTANADLKEFIANWTGEAGNHIFAAQEYIGIYSTSFNLISYLEENFPEYYDELVKAGAISPLPSSVSQPSSDSSHSSAPYQSSTSNFSAIEHKLQLQTSKVEKLQPQICCLKHDAVYGVMLELVAQTPQALEEFKQRLTEEASRTELKLKLQQLCSDISSALDSQALNSSTLSLDTEVTEPTKSPIAQAIAKQLKLHNFDGIVSQLSLNLDFLETDANHQDQDENQSNRSCYQDDSLLKSTEEYLNSYDAEAGFSRETLGYFFANYQGNYADLLNIATNPEYRGLGLGRIMFKIFAQIAEITRTMGLTLEVRVSNQPAISLYESFGLKKVNRLIAIYQSSSEGEEIPEDGWLMSKDF